LATLLLRLWPLPRRVQLLPRRRRLQPLSSRRHRCPTLLPPIVPTFDIAAHRPVMSMSEHTHDAPLTFVRTIALAGTSAATIAAAHLCEGIIVDGDSMRPSALRLLSRLPIAEGNAFENKCVYTLRSAASHPRFRTAVFSCSPVAVHGLAIVNASALIPRSIRAHVTGAAIGNPSRARGEYVPIAVVPRPLRK
jgi:hypothetical protein